MSKNTSYMNESKLYVQYGCGWATSIEWRNFDASPTLRFERLPIIGHLYTKNKNRFPKIVEYGDIVKGLPIKDASCDGLYCSHILEHLSLHCFRAALRNSSKYLKSGGVFRLVLPDLEYYIAEYLNTPNYDAAIHFMHNTSLGHTTRPRGIKEKLQHIFGNSQHLWMWDFKSISHELTNAGFTNIRRAAFADSHDPMFKLVEDSQRWQNCLGIECYKSV